MPAIFQIFNFLRNNKIDFIHANDYIILVKFDGHMDENYWRVDITHSSNKPPVLESKQISREEFQNLVESRF